MQIESGPSGERKVRTSLLFLMVAVFAVWFAYDGWIGYPQKNREEHLDQLPPEEREKANGVRIYASVTKETLPAARVALKKRTVAGQREALEKLYDGPPSYENEDVWYYFGPTFGVAIPLEKGKPAKLSAHRTKKSSTDIIGQKVLAVVLGILSLYLLRLLIRTFRTHLVLSEDGLTYQGDGPIGWDDMKRLDAARFSKKGWVDLIYQSQGDERRLRLDEYHLAKFDDVIDELCKRKGFENPLPVKSAS